MLAAVSMEMVAGSRVSKAAVTSPCLQRPPHNMDPTSEVAESEEEQAVSRLTAGPAEDNLHLVAQHDRPWSATLESCVSRSAPWHEDRERRPRKLSWACCVLRVRDEQAVSRLPAGHAWSISLIRQRKQD